MSQFTSSSDDNHRRRDSSYSANSIVSVGSGSDFTLDTILVYIGQFGKYQLAIFTLVCISEIFNAVCSSTYVFTASTVVHRCNITECDTPLSVYDEPWTEFSIPKANGELYRCSRYVNSFDYNGTGSSSEQPIDQCAADCFDSEMIEKCDTHNLIFYNDELTISNDFGIYCDEEWKLAFAGTVNNIGQFIGIPLGGVVSDRFGRRTAIALGGFLSAICGIVRSFSPSYAFFLAFELLDNVANSTLYSTCFIVGMELVGPKCRVIAGCTICCFYAVGEVLLAIVAKYYTNWRVLLRIFYVPALLHLVLFWLLPESVRWLLSQGQEERAKRTLQRAATVNKRRLSDYTLDKLISSNREKMLMDEGKKFPFKEALCKYFWRNLNCALCWIVNAFVYYGLSLNAVFLNGDKYINYVYISLAEIPGYFLSYAMMNRFGRRYSLFAFLMVSGLCCLSTMFVLDTQITLNLILFLIGKLSITASFQVLYFLASEIYPTNIRNSLLCFYSMIGRIGSMLAPFTPLLVKYNKNLPSILFGGAAILSGSLSLLFPETKDLILPATMKEAENIGMKKKKSSKPQSQIYTVNTSTQSVVDL